jgi:hypothetical protein
LAIKASPIASARPDGANSGATASGRPIADSEAGVIMNENSRIKKSLIILSIV